MYNMYMNDRLTDVWQTVWYGVLGRRPDIDFSQLADNIDFKPHYDEINKTHWIEAVNLPDFIVTAKDPQDLPKRIQETLMVYYDVPRYFAKRIKLPEYKFTFPNQKTKELENYTSNYKEELERSLA